VTDPELVVGPQLRYVDASSATIWVETDRAGTAAVEIPGRRAATATTFTVHGHHYALVDLTDLAPGSDLTYELRMDGHLVWPERSVPVPPSRIRTLDPDRPLRVAFGSCRKAAPHDAVHVASHGVDLLRAYARRLASEPPEHWPDLLLLLGDQVYADDVPAKVRQVIAERRNASRPPGWEVADFEEYTQLYREAWRDRWVRWLLSTVPSAMIFDDHDIRDDWNISAEWRSRIASEPWWEDRIVGGLGACWLYQHLGNLSPAERAADPLVHAVRTTGTAPGDAGRVLDRAMRTADTQPGQIRWSYARDLGRVRLVMLDSRSRRVLTPGDRRMLDDTEWAWADQHLRGDTDHLLVGTSLPYLLPPGLHHAEAWNELLADGAWGRALARRSERLRQSIDLEHWAAFGRSFAAMADAVAEIVTGRRGTAPATLSFLSGDVHYSYAARATLRAAADPTATSRIWQLVCSPLRNPLSRELRWANVAASTRPVHLATRALTLASRLRASTLRWTLPVRPRFDNALAICTFSGRTAEVRWLTADARPYFVTDEAEPALDTSMRRLAGLTL
jgi:phosphodiesterase/alkaline phosphatase D-like protein